MRTKTPRVPRDLFKFSDNFSSLFRLSISDGRSVSLPLENQIDLKIGQSGGGVKHRRRVQVGTRRVYLRHMSRCRFERSRMFYSTKADKYYQIHREIQYPYKVKYYYESPRYRNITVYTDNAASRKMTAYSRTLCEVSPITLNSISTRIPDVNNRIIFNFNSWTSFGESFFYDSLVEEYEDEDELEEVINDLTVAWNAFFITNHQNDQISTDPDDLRIILENLFSKKISLRYDLLFSGSRTGFLGEWRPPIATISNFVDPFSLLERVNIPINMVSFETKSSGLPIGSLSWYEFCSYLLKKRAIDNLDRNIPQLLTFLAELPETVKSFAAILEISVLIARALKARDFDTVLKLVVGERGNLLRRISKKSINISLFYKFGLLPFLEDLKAIWDLAENLDKLGFYSPSIKKRTRLDVSTLFDIKSRDIGGTVREAFPIDGKDFTLTYSYRISITKPVVTLQYANEMKIINPISFLVERMGLNSVLGTAWELVPLSFVIDWFVNIGDALQRLSIPVDGYEIFDECITHTTELEGTIYLTDISLFSESEEFIFPDSTCQLRAMSTIRDLSNPSNRVDELQQAAIDLYQPGRSLITIPTSITAAQLLLQRLL